MFCCGLIALTSRWSLMLRLPYAAPFGGSLPTTSCNLILVLSNFLASNYALPGLGPLHRRPTEWNAYPLSCYLILNLYKWSSLWAAVLDLVFLRATISDFPVLQARWEKAGELGTVCTPCPYSLAKGQSFFFIKTGSYRLLESDQSFARERANHSFVSGHPQIPNRPTAGAGRKHLSDPRNSC